jgi:two-component system CheB/CheR fusion protein
VVGILREDEPEPSASAAPTGSAPSTADTNLIQQLEEELTTTKEDLRLTIEDLRASNQELMLVNEELQSSNEELETSKEELQSLNEELGTVNSQLEGKIAELEDTNSDLDNLLTSTKVATLFLDPQLRIRRFTPAATALQSHSRDIGRPIGDIAQGSRIRPPNRYQAVLQQLVAGKRSAGVRRSARPAGLPYLNATTGPGVVITFSDVAARPCTKRGSAESIADIVRTVQFWTATRGCSRQPLLLHHVPRFAAGNGGPLGVCAR